MVIHPTEILRYGKGPRFHCCGVKPPAKCALLLCWTNLIVHNSPLGLVHNECLVDRKCHFLCS